MESQQRNSRGTQGQFNRGGSSRNLGNIPNKPDESFSFQGFNDGYQTPLDSLIEATEYKLAVLYQARDGYISADRIESGVIGDRMTNPPSSRSSSGQQFDGRTMAGRQMDDEGVSPQELNSYLASAPRNDDESVDLRTTEGRALKAAGWVDDDGFEISDITQQYRVQGKMGGRRFSGQPSNSKTGQQ